MAAQFGRRLRKGAVTTAVAAAAVAALSASQAPGATVDDHGRSTAADAQPSPDATAGDSGATGNSPYYTDLPPLNTPSPAPTDGTSTVSPVESEAGIPATVLDAYKKAAAELQGPSPAAICPGSCSPPSARSSRARPAAAGSTRTAPPPPRSSARSSTATASNSSRTPTTVPTTATPPTTRPSGPCSSSRPPGRG